MRTCTLICGDSPVVISLPHVGTQLPEELLPQLSAPARALPDTDWHVDQLYDFAFADGYTVLRALYSRYLIDLNRPPDDAPLYPGSNTSGLCPTLDFAGAPIWTAGAAPVPPQEVARRLRCYWEPYHAELAARLAAAQARHGYAVLIDGHSIRSRVPRLFAGRLPDINVGTADGAACSAALRTRAQQQLLAQARFSHVLDGRFKGGYITRHYGRPDAGVHALQIELAQCAYMNEESPAYTRSRATPLRELLRSLLAALAETAAAA
ncbi:MAG: N-formylglutamate deformylase [Gammaproteobacteria bacterium]|nr:N-formylglutamate deformylase [Gammaproteobacteria bacterium]